MNHSTEQHSDKHPKQDFQVERLAFFSDAVFAIAITLLVIELKVPHFTNDTTYQDVLKDLKELKFQFFALILSFSIIANYWLKHHLLFKHIHNYNEDVVKYNLIVLLPIIFFPFTTAFVYENLTHLDIIIIPFRLILANNIFASFATYFLYWIVTVKHKHLSYPMEKKDKESFTQKLLWTGISFTIIFAFTFFLPFEYATLGVIPLVIVNLKRKFFPSHKK